MLVLYVSVFLQFLWINPVAISNSLSELESAGKKDLGISPSGHFITY